MTPKAARTFIRNALTKATDEQLARLANVPHESWSVGMPRFDSDAKSRLRASLSGYDVGAEQRILSRHTFAGMWKRPLERGNHYFDDRAYSDFDRGISPSDAQRADVVAQSVFWVLISPEILVSDAAVFLAPWRAAGLPLPKGYPGG